MLWILAAILSLTSTSSSRPINRTNAVEEKFCRVGNASFPVPVFESYAGWECYEETYRGMKNLTVQVCVEKAGDAVYSVPCFKWNEKTLSFNLKNEESVFGILEAVGSRERNDELIRCYLSVVTACETSPGGWLGFNGGCRFFVGNKTGNVCGLEGQSKFHIAMLSISLIVGIPVAFVLAYCSAASESSALSHCRNLVLALITRTFFSLLIETEVVSEIIKLGGEPIVNWAGCEALASFETITLNVVLAFWLNFTFFIFESSKSQFQKTPDVRKGLYIVLGLSTSFAIIWIIIMAAGGYGNCWLERTPIQWVNDALRLGFILLQIVLTSVVCFRALTVFRGSADAQMRLLGKGAFSTLCLSPLFLLQFSLSASHPVEQGEGEAHIYTEFFFDGLQCGIVSAVFLYIFLSTITDFDFILIGINHCLGRKKQCQRVFETTGGTEVEIRQGDAPPRVARVPSPTTNGEDEERKDIKYTSVLTPERFERTIKLYNRLNVIPKEETFGDALQDNSSVKSDYFDVENDSVNTVYKEVIGPTRGDEKRPYYNSKYLVYDTEPSASEESSTEIPAEVREPPVRQSSPSSSSAVLPPEEVDASREVEKWLSNCHREFWDYAEKAVQKKSAIPTQNGIHRSLSGSILTGSDIPGSVRVPLEIPAKGESVIAKKGSVPSLITSDEEELMKKQEELPSIYNDLKVYSRVRQTKPPRKRELNANWSSYRNRVLDHRRKVKSHGDVDPEESERGRATPRYDRKGLQDGSLRRNHFSGMEDLTKVDDSGNWRETDQLETMKRHSVDDQLLSEARHAKV